MPETETILPYADAGYSERELLDRLQDGSVDAFTILYKQYSGALYLNMLALVKSEFIAEELVQEVFAKVWEKRHCIRIEKSFNGYLCRIGQNRVYDFYRKLRRERLMFERFRATATENYTHVEEAADWHHAEARVQHVLQSLSPQQQRTFQLCKTEGRSYKEAAELLGISAYTVKEHLVKAMSTIRQRLEGSVDKIFLVAIACHLLF